LNGIGQIKSDTNPRPPWSPTLEATDRHLNLRRCDSRCKWHIACKLDRMNISSIRARQFGILVFTVSSALACGACGNADEVVNTKPMPSPKGCVDTERTASLLQPLCVPGPQEPYGPDATAPDASSADGGQSETGSCNSLPLPASCSSIVLTSTPPVAAGGALTNGTYLLRSIAYWNGVPSTIGVGSRWRVQGNRVDSVVDTGIGIIRNTYEVRTVGNMMQFRIVCTTQPQPNPTEREYSAAAGAIEFLDRRYDVTGKPTSAEMQRYERE
jgi:hypothetical protein